MYSLLTTLAMAAPGQGQSNPLQMFMPMLIILGIFYFMLIRPQQRKEKQRKEMISNIESGSRVVFSGGILGTVTNVKEHSFMIKIAENVKVEVARGAVSRVLDKGEKPGEEEEK